MSSEITPERALAVIEGLCLAAASEDPFILQIYEIAHIGGSTKCKNKHNDWKKKFLEIEKKLINEKIIS